MSVVRVVGSSEGADQLFICDTTGENKNKKKKKKVKIND